MSQFCSPTSSAAAGQEVCQYAIGTDASGNHYRIYQFVDEFGNSRLVSVSNRAISERPQCIITALADAGFMVPTTPQGQRELLKQLASQAPTRAILVSNQPGWVNGIFATYAQVHRPRPSQTDALLTANLDHRFVVAGTLKEWQHNVAELLKGNQLGIFCLSVAFTGPILDIVGGENGGFQLVGSSSSGKTTCAKVAGSVWGGGGSQGFLRSWLATVNAMDSLATAHNDCILVLDESNLAMSHGEASPSVILESAYRLVNGETKKRLTDTTAPTTWRLVFLSTSEVSLSQIAERSKQPLHPGQAVRLTDIAFDAGKNIGAFECLHDRQSASEFAQELGQNALRFHGTAADAFLRRLVSERASESETLCRHLKRRQDRYMAYAKPLCETGQASRIAKRFALVYAAGALAQRYGILPFTIGEIKRAIFFAHSRVIGLDKINAVPVTPVQMVARFISANMAKLTAFDGAGLSKATIDQHIGFIRETSKGAEYLFTSDAFREKICSNVRADEVFAELKRNGLINLQRGSNKWTVHRTFPASKDRVRVISLKCGAGRSS